MNDKVEEEEEKGRHKKAMYTKPAYSLGLSIAVYQYNNLYTSNVHHYIILH